MSTEVTTSWHSYPKVFALGHSAIRDIFLDPVVVEEKVDGSQFSFGVFGDELRCRSKGQQLIVDAPEKMFSRAVATARELAPLLHEGWTYRCEYLQTPKHNVLAYDRTPARNLVLFDINTGHEAYLSRVDKEAEAARIGLECVPVLSLGRVENLEAMLDLLKTTSFLGGQKIEGLVFKNYLRFSPDGKAMIGKYVAEAFKEVHQGDWRERNPKSGDILERLIFAYRSPARWSKAVQHLREAGMLEGSPKDIGAIMREVPADVRAECEQEIGRKLMEWAWPHIARGISAGLPEWYKQELAKSAFASTGDTKDAA